MRSEPQGLNATPGKATRIMYKSTDNNGQPVAVTGTYIEPTAKYSGTGRASARRLRRGHQGQGDSCAPSKSLESGYVGGTIQGFSAGYEIPGINALVNAGVGVVVTDYIGLGTTDRIHTYVDRVDQGNAVLDAARAAVKVSGASVTTASPRRLLRLLAGWRRRCCRRGAAAVLRPGRQPQGRVRRWPAGRPRRHDEQGRRHDLTAVIGYAINGFVQSDPSLKTILDAQTNAAGKAALNEIKTQCVANSIASFAFKKTKDWTVSGKSITDVVNGIPAAKAVIDEQKLGKLKPTVPIRIVTGTQDDIVPHPQAKQLAKDYCDKGVNVGYVGVVQFLTPGAPPSTTSTR